MPIQVWRNGFSITKHGHINENTFIVFVNQYFVSPMYIKTRCVCETQMPKKETNSIDSHAYVKAFEK
jgi:hypothetical protein